MAKGVTKTKDSVEKSNSQKNNNGGKKVRGLKGDEMIAKTKTSAAMLEEFDALLENIRNGRLDARADVDAVSGADRKMLEGVNEILRPVERNCRVCGPYQQGRCSREDYGRLQGRFQ